MKINFKDGSYIEFTTDEESLCINMCGKKSDGTLASSNSFINKTETLNLIKFLFYWLDK